jgi:hypothetical protein
MARERDVRADRGASARHPRTSAEEGEGDSQPGKAYATPVLTEYGSVYDLTRGAGSGSPEAFGLSGGGT